MQKQTYLPKVQEFHEKNQFSNCLSAIKLAVENHEIPPMQTWKEAFVGVKSMYSEWNKQGDREAQTKRSAEFKRICAQQINLLDTVIGAHDEQTTAQAAIFKQDIQTVQNDLEPKDNELNALMATEQMLRAEFEQVKHLEPAHNHTKLMACNRLCANLYDQYELSGDERKQIECVLIMARTLLPAQKSTSDATFLDQQPPAENELVTQMLEQLSSYQPEYDLTNGGSVAKVIEDYGKK